MKQPMEQLVEQKQKTAIEITPATLIGGLVVGFLATQALDWVSTIIYENEDQQTYDDENAARGGHHAYESGVKNMAKPLGKELNDQEMREYGWKFHRTFGVISGLQYVILRKKFPSIGWGFGFLYGTGFFLIVDEFLMAALKLTPGPTKFSWKVHARGFASHLAYGMVSEITARILDFASEKSIQVTRYARNSSLYSGHVGDDRSATQLQS